MTNNGQHLANGRAPRAALTEALPPHSREAERSMLGGMLGEPSMIAEAAGMVTQDDYYVVGHGKIHRGIAEMQSAGKGIDVVTVGDWLITHGLVEEIGGLGYLSDLWGDRPSLPNFRSYAEIIRAHAMRRQLAKVADELRAEALDECEPPGIALQHAEQRLRKIGSPIQTLAPESLGEMLVRYPAMREPLIDGLLRVGETMNIIAAPKTGKSWLAGGLAASIATGRDWMGFATTPGNVLLIDNELHKETLTARLRRIGEGYGCLDEILHRVDIVAMRGQLKDLYAIGDFLKRIEPGRYRFVILDAFYRAIPIGIEENSNAAIASLYNLIDSLADRLQCGFGNIHHATKGNQAEKGITDVGSGAGSQSRAADAHVVLRPHQEEGVVVLEAAVRSFQPVAAKCLRWEWPFFSIADGLDPTDLATARRGKKPTERNEAESAKSAREKLDEAAVLLRLDKLDAGNGVSFNELRDTVQRVGRTSAEKAICRLIEQGFVEWIDGFTKRGGNGAKIPSKGVRRKSLR